MRTINFIFLASFLAFGTFANAQKIEAGLKPQSEIQRKAEHRKFDAPDLKDFRSEAEFRYESDHSKKTNLLSRIWNWLVNFINQLFYLGGRSSLGKIVFYGIMIAAIVYTILKIVKANPVDILVKSRSRVNYHIDIEDIHSISFEEQIADALEEKNYKLAVRLYYLFALKNLTDRGIIIWKPGKSNNEYIYEIGKNQQRGSFIDLSRLFEYAWYGGFEIDKTAFEKSKSYFKILYEAV